MIDRPTRRRRTRLAAIAMLLLLTAGLVASSLRSSDVDLATRCATSDGWSKALNRADQARDLPALEFRTREYAAVVGSKQLRVDLEDMADELDQLHASLPLEGSDDRDAVDGRRSSDVADAVDDLPAFERFVDHFIEQRSFECAGPTNRDAAELAVPKRAERFCDELRRGDTVGFELDESRSKAETRERVAIWRKAAKRVRSVAPREIRAETDRIVDFAEQLHVVLERYGYVLPLANVPTPVPDDVRTIEAAFGVYFADALAVDSFGVDVCQ